MATLTVSDSEPRAQYTATNAQTAFTYSFPIFTDGDLKVYIGSTLKTLTTDYTVSGAGTSAGGTVTLVTGATTGDIVTIYRDLPIARSSDYQTGGALLSETLNDDFDKLVMMAQQNESAINTRSIRFSNTSGDLPLPELVGDATARANMTLIFDASGNPALDDTGINVSTITDNIDTINTVAGDLNGSRDSFDYGSIASTDPVSNPASPTGALQGVYDIRTDITTVSGISANVTTVADNDTNITTIAGNMTAINNAQTAANNAAADAASAETARAAAVVAKGAAETAETNAETAETAAETAETNAETAETGAVTAKTASETAKTASETAKTASESAKTGAETAETGAVTAKTASETAKTASETAKTASETAKTASETAKTGSETAETGAVTAKTAAETAKTASETAQTAAESAKTSAETAYDNFDDRYLGQKSSDPSVDNDSNALLTGAIYFNTATSAMKVYNGSAWTNVAPVATSVTASQISDVTATATELNYTDGVTSAIQTQIDGKQASDADLTTLATNGIGTSANQIVQLNGSAELPAVSAANLTNLPASGATNLNGLNDCTVSASDPTSTSNPSAVGHLWVNTTSGETYICTNATTGANTWTNIGEGTGGFIPTALSSPTLNSPADEEPDTNVTYVITSVDANDDKIVFDVQASSFTIQSVSVGSATKVGTTVEITGFSASSTITLILQYTAEATYNNRAKSIDTAGAYPDSAWSSTDTIVIVVPPVWYGGRGLFFGGNQRSSFDTTIDYVTISTTGNATDFGNLTVGRWNLSSCSDGTRGVSGEGYQNGGNSTVLDYVTISTTGNATDFGDITAHQAPSACCDGTRGVWGGGEGPSNIMDYVTMATTGNSTDFGNLTVSRHGSASFSNGTRGVWCGGNPSELNTIDYVTMATTGNATDFGDLTVSRGNIGYGLSDDTRGLAGGGFWPAVNTIDYVTIATTGNATDFGDLTAVGSGGAGSADGSRGIFGGGNYRLTTIDYVTIQTTGNATDFGDLTGSGSRYFGGCSGD